MALPEEIIYEEIIFRLPVESLMRFRLVCKSWNSFISDPNFPHSDLTFTSQNPHTNEFLIVNNCIPYCERKSANDPYYYISLISRNNLSETRINKVPFPVSSNDIELIGSINGLVCIACLSQQDYHFILWNPVIRRFKKIFPLECFLNNMQPYYPSRCVFAFGWDMVINDYKLVVKPPYSLQCGVYSTKTDSWGGILVSEYFRNLVDDVSRTPCTIVKGCPYWYMDQQSIVKVEIESNNFRCFQFSNVSKTCYYLINLNDCLCRVEYGGVYNVDVYHLDGEREVWSKMYAIYFGRLYWPSMCFKYGGEIVLNKKKYLYDHKSKQIKSINYDKEGHFVNGFSHTPSLVIVKGMKDCMAKSVFLH